ncbi:gene transfer agent family protein [Zavarzinia sp. CC-PAN008]|uniref:gene transfer agent family protein n=1 Tax=Zavarzinia sp. CC-PAN008 TaxID=3243332 RepID=UPI003F7464D3
MANPHRGEVDLVIGPHHLTLRPTFEALVEIEERAGTGLIPLTRRFLSRDFGLKDALAVIGPAAKAGGRVPDDLGPALVAHGLVGLGPALAGFLVRAVAGPDPATPATRH